MLLAESDQMVLFDEERYEFLIPESLLVPASARRFGAGQALGLMLVALSWVPIAFLIWLLT